MTKKDALATLVVKSSIARLREWLWRDSADYLRVLAYHRVLDPELDGYLFDEDLVSTSIRAFDLQMNYLSRHFAGITFHELLECVRDGRRLPRRAVIITFDDGYEDNYLHAFPILRKYHLPATIFVATHYIGSSEVFWFESLAYWFKATRQKELCLQTLSLPPLSLSPPERRRSLSLLRCHLLGVDNGARLKALQEIREQLQVEIPPSHRSWVATLSWDQIREMCASGIEFGSHTVSHPALSRLSEVELREELEHSKRKIESETGREVVSIAYPFGGREVFNEVVKREVAKSGYAFGVSYIEGIDAVNSMDSFEIKRIPIERDVSLEMFRCQLLFPRIFVG